MKLFQTKTHQNHKIPLFITKLRQILSEPAYYNIATWSEDGESFEIKNSKKLEELVLPRYFRHSKTSSFIRQLNMYGFYKKKNITSKIVFWHQNFRKNNSEDINFVRRNNNSVQTKSYLTTDYTEPSCTPQTLNNISDVRQANDSDSIQKEPDQPISQLLSQIIQQINSEDIVFEYDIRARVKELSRVEPYTEIKKKFIPFILDSLGLEPQFELDRQINYNFSAEDLKNSYSVGSSLSLIL